MLNYSEIAGLLESNGWRKIGNNQWSLEDKIVVLYGTFIDFYKDKRWDTCSDLTCLKRHLNLNSSVEDRINKPGHYYTTVNGTEVDCLAVVEALGFQRHHYIASAFAYIWRCLKKDATLMDLKKAVFFLNREITWREDAKNNKE